MKATSLLLVGFFIAQHVNSQTASERSQQYNIKKSIAIEGYDPVSYFDHQPQEGKSSITQTYKGITYLFASVTNQTKIQREPRPL